ncbi:MAG: sugar phosphate isomerase/epimerase [Chitinophagaceae bacterium]
MKTRRNFLRASALTIAAPLLNPFSSTASILSKKRGPDLNIGIAGFTFAQFSYDQAIAMMQRINVKNLSLKEMHLPLNATQEQATALVEKSRAAGINIYTVGVIYMKDKSEVDRAFNYAKMVGVNMVIGVPEYDLLPYTEEVVKASGIRIAIHNHGPEDKRYPGPKDVYDRIKNMDEKMGLCLDIGHALRAGEDPARAIVAYKDRMFDFHIKDVTAKARDAKAIEIGRGAMDFPAVVTALRKIKYTGMCSIEYEKDMKDPMPGICESVGFFRGVMKSV